MTLITDILPPTRRPLPTPTKDRLPRQKLAIGGGLAAILLAGFIALGLHPSNHTPVPAQVRQAVTFPIYYPSPQKLPAGHSLDTSSFRLAQPGVVVYSVTNRAGQAVIFSEEKQPERNIIDQFTNSSIPLHTDLKTSKGQAEFGAYGTGKNLRTVVSLPINGGPWVIVTAPASSSHAELVQIVQALTR